jgi:hypothetical protein
VVQLGDWEMFSMGVFHRQPAMELARRMGHVAVTRATRASSAKEGADEVLFLLRKEERLLHK